MNIRQLFDLTGRVAIVTGGSLGLGQQMARALADSGAHVVLAARKVERCAAEAQHIQETYGVKALPFRCDITHPEEVKALVKKTIEELGRLDILVNNAGISWGAPPEVYPLEKWRSVIEVNLTGSFITAQEAALAMKAQGKGKIINISSIAAFIGENPELMNAVAYNASKGAVLSMTRDLAVKWAPYGIRVNAIAPGWFPTHMSRRLLEKYEQPFLQQIPLGRFGNEDDLKGAVVYLASAASDYVTGQVIIIDGGRVISK